MSNRVVVRATVVVGGFLLCQGCGVFVRGPEGEIQATIKQGTLTAKMDRGIDRIFEAVQEAIKDLGFTTVLAEQDGVAAEVLARDAQQENIVIKLGALSPSSTQLTMRVGIFGDNNKSRVIFRKVQEHLQKR